jgi:luciferase family oxidoreductase group 1
MGEPAEGLPTIKPVRLSVLDQSPIPEGLTGADAVHNTLDLARLTERLGYHRYWVAEHHGGPMLAGASPEVLIAAIAGVTSTMRVGSGGVMLPHYSPFKVAEVFTILAALHPRRIDLGLGRASGTDPLTTFALQRDRRQASPDDFPQQLSELLAYLDNSLPDDHPFARLADVLPGGPGARPEPWLLGSSPQSAIWAAQLDLPYAFADFINPDGAEIAGLYRTRLTSEHPGRPHRTAVAVWALCAETDEEAEHLASSSRMAMRLLRQGTLIAVPPADRAARWLSENARPGTGAPPGRRTIVGTPERVRAGLERVAEDYMADEIIVVTITHDHEARRRSYELVAQEMIRPGDRKRSGAVQLP